VAALADGVALPETRAEVAQKLTQALHDAGKGVPVVDERQTVKQYLTTWYESMKPQVRISSYRRYGDYVNHLIPALGHVALAKLTPQHLQTFYNRKLGEGLSPTTVHAIHAMLHRALKDAMQLGW
jgi:DNA-binding IclR family transcriptional regulator